MQDITPLLKGNIKSINSYGAGGFNISGEKVEGTVIIHEETFHNISCKELSALQLSDIINKIDVDKVEILIVGSGEKSDFLNSEIEKELKGRAVKIEYMNTGAAARTYNVLITEERNVAAILIAV